MIVSFKHKYIFVHCRKTAGSSIAVSLARDLGPDDVLLSGVPETVAHGIGLPKSTIKAARSVGGLRLALAKVRGTETYARKLSSAVHMAYVPSLGQKPQHAPITKVRDAFPNVFSSFFKFGVVRNPWDRAVSDFYWMTRRLDERPPFEDWMRAIEAGTGVASMTWHIHHDNWPIYAEGGKIIADRLVRYEALSEDLGAALSEADVPFDGWLPRARSGFRKPEGANGYRDLHTQETKAIVERLYKAEIEAFCYAF